MTLDFEFKGLAWRGAADRKISRGESQRCSAGGDARGAGQDDAGAGNAMDHWDYGAGANISNAAIRKWRPLLREHLNSAIAATVAATLLALASGRASRT